MPDKTDPPARTLRDVYPKGSMRSRVNAAIRAEIPGGSEVLDLLSALDFLVHEDGNAALKGELRLAHAARNKMAEHILAKYPTAKQRNGSDA